MLKYILLFALLIGIFLPMETPIQHETKLCQDGFVSWEVSYPEHIDWQDKIKIVENDVLNLLPDGYRFLDYSYYIQGCSLSTFHRDVTSCQHILNTKYPTYTVAIYEFDGDFISVCPKSHLTYPFVFSQPLKISGRRNTLVLFNADLVHAGIINTKGLERKIIQFKVVHESDMDLVQHLKNIDVRKTQDCTLNPTVELFLRKLSWIFAFFVNLCSPLLQKRYKNGISSMIQSMIPVSFYNNVNN